MPKVSRAKLAQIANWRSANKDKVKSYGRKYARKPESRKRNTVNMARWRRENPERVKASLRRRREADPEGWRLRHRNAKLKVNYGITLADYDRMLDEQKGVCAICGGAQDKAFPWRLAVDHDKQTGKVRALLCSKCNMGIGSFDHDLAKLRAAISYLHKHKGAACK